MIGLVGVCGAVIGGVVMVSVAQPEGQAPFKLPKGWTMEDMQKCTTAGIPGERQAELVRRVGTWEGAGKMWIGPDGDSIDMDCVMTVTGLMDGRYIRTDLRGEMPGLGSYHGEGVTGYDNVAKEYQGDWIDNMGSGVMFGRGTRSGDGTTFTMEHSFTCPITEKGATLRQVDRFTRDGKWVQEMFGTDPKSGVEYKMMSFTYTRR